MFKIHPLHWSKSITCVLVTWQQPSRLSALFAIKHGGNMYYSFKMATNLVNAHEMKTNRPLRTSFVNTCIKKNFGF